MRTFSCLLVVLALGLIAPCSVLADGQPGDKPDIQFTTTDGKVVNSKVLAGRITVLDFWATWCGPCVRAMPHMKKIHETYGPKGVLVFGISRDRDFKKMEAWCKEKGYDWPQCGNREDSNRLASAFAVRGIPNIAIIGPDGTVLWRGHPARMDEPIEEAFKKYGAVLAKTMRNQDDEPATLDQETLEIAMGHLELAEQSLQAKNYDDVFTHFQKVPDVAYTDNSIRLRCREIITIVNALDRQELKEFNDIRRRDIELAKAYGAVLRAARQARSNSS